MISRLFAAVVLVVGLATAAPAGAQTGLPCVFQSIPDPTVPDYVQTVVMSGGPLFAADLDHPGEETTSIYLKCSIHLGWSNRTHAGASVYTITSETRLPHCGGSIHQPPYVDASYKCSVGVAVIPPTPVSFYRYDVVFVCTEAIVNGQHRYWDSQNREWSHSGATC